ncbi:hypothetical protein [Paremcibacter congregatus]|uniref:hypothetical protein n=1 Tax=Paremcibacter congregatus TaxID=2043170 RepID=UPI0030EC5064|tara:strand:+ start:5328 stop:5906 length:579 start_codon:yes stop_codon:yes gene_type:complete
MNKIAITGLSLFAALCMSFSVQAATPLSRDNIESFIAVMKPMQKLEEKYDILEEDGSDMQSVLPGSETFGPMTHSLKTIRTHKSFPEFAKIIDDAGFTSPDQWANVGDRILNAYMGLKMAANMSPADVEKMQESIAELEKNEYLSPETKAQMLVGLKQGLAMMTNPSDQVKADQKALKPYMRKLEILFEDTE